MIPHLDKYKRLKKLSSIPKLWNVKATPVTDQLNSEPLIVSDIQYKTGENNIPLAVADPLDFNTAEIYTATAYYSKTWLYSTLWHLYEKKYSTLLNNFFELVFYEEAITHIDFQFSGEWHVATTAELTLGHNTYQADGEGIDTIINLLKTQIDLTDNTVKTSINEEHTLTINVGARLPQIYNIQAKVINPTHLEAINFTTQYQQVEKKIQAHATDITTSLNYVLVDSDDNITFGHTIKTISPILNAPSVQLDDDDSVQDLILGLGVTPPGYQKQCLPDPGEQNNQRNCYFALFLVQLKTLINPNPESFIEPTEFRDHLIYRLSDEEYTECNLKNLLGVTQIGERAYPLYRGNFPEYEVEFLTDYYAVDNFTRNRNWSDMYNEYFNDTPIFPHYVDLDFTVNEESNNNRWIIDSDPLYGIYGTHINDTSTKRFRIYLENLNLKIEELPSSGNNALRFIDSYDEYSLTDFSWTDYAISQGQLHPSRQLNSAPFVELDWNPHSHEGMEYRLQLENQTVDYLLPYHQYKNTHWHSSVSHYLQDTEDENLAWRIAKFKLKYNNNTIYETKYAYFFDGYSGLTEYDPINQTLEEAFQWFEDNQNNNMFFLAVPHKLNANETLIQPITRITKETFLREYPIALGRTATIIDTSIENAICYVYVGWWRNQVHQKCKTAYQLIENLLPVESLNSDFTNIINELEHIYEQDFDMSYLESQFWQDYFRQPQFDAFQTEIEAEKARRIPLIPAWRENLDQLITLHNTEHNKLDIRGDIKQELKNFLFMQYDVIINNFASMEMIAMLSVGQSYVIIQP
jgi:hypothetical protein